MVRGAIESRRPLRRVMEEPCPVVGARKVRTRTLHRRDEHESRDHRVLPPEDDAGCVRQTRGAHVHGAAGPDASQRQRSAITVKDGPLQV